jgi:hypothetical protein
VSLTNVIALLECQAGEATRSTRSRRGQNTTSFSVSAEAAIPCESENEVDEVFDSFTRARARTRTEGETGELPPSTSSTSLDLPPSTVTLLRHCRCQDCQRFSRDGNRYTCDAGIGGTKVGWSDGHAECDPAPHAWHYCAEYLGPTAGRHLVVWRYDDVAQQDAHVGPRAQTAAEATKDATVTSPTPRGPTSREGECQRGEDRKGA